MSVFPLEKILISRICLTQACPVTSNICINLNDTIQNPYWLEDKKGFNDKIAVVLDNQG